MPNSGLAQIETRQKRSLDSNPQTNPKSPPACPWASRRLPFGVIAHTCGFGPWRDVTIGMKPSVWDAIPNFDV